MTLISATYSINWRKPRIVFKSFQKYFRHAFSTRLQFDGVMLPSGSDRSTTAICKLPTMVFKIPNNDRENVLRSTLSFAQFSSSKRLCQLIPVSESVKSEISMPLKVFSYSSYISNLSSVDPLSYVASAN